MKILHVHEVDFYVMELFSSYKKHVLVECLGVVKNICGVYACTCRSEKVMSLLKQNKESSV